MHNLLKCRELTMGCQGSTDISTTQHLNVGFGEHLEWSRKIVRARGLEHVLRNSVFGL